MSGLLSGFEWYSGDSPEDKRLKLVSAHLRGFQVDALTHEDALYVRHETLADRLQFGLAQVVALDHSSCVLDRTFQLVEITKIL